MYIRKVVRYEKSCFIACEERKACCPISKVSEMEREEREDSSSYRLVSLLFLFGSIFPTSKISQGFGANVDNIKKSSYTDEERYQIAAFVAYVNGDTVYSDRSSSWFGRCLRDTYKISKPSIDAIVRDVKRKNFWAAASKLFLAIKVGSSAASHPRISIATAAAGYLAFCGANKVS